MDHRSVTSEFFLQVGVKATDQKRGSFCARAVEYPRRLVDMRKPVKILAVFAQGRVGYMDMSIC